MSFQTMSFQTLSFQIMSFQIIFSDNVFSDFDFSDFADYVCHFSSIAPFEKNMIIFHNFLQPLKS